MQSILQWLKLIILLGIYDRRPPRLKRKLMSSIGMGKNYALARSLRRQHNAAPMQMPPTAVNLERLGSLRKTAFEYSVAGSLLTIGSSVFAQFTRVPNTQTDSQYRIYLHWAPRHPLQLNGDPR